MKNLNRVHKILTCLELVKPRYSPMRAFEVKLVDKPKSPIGPSHPDKD